MVDLLLYGLQRSGTNYLEALLAKKYHVQFLNNHADRSSPAHKHFRLYDQKEIIPEPQYRNDLQIHDFDDFERQLEEPADYYLVISKDPYSWLLSYERWATICHWPEMPHHYLEEYNLFYGKWLQLARQTEKIIFVKYVDLLRSTSRELRRLEKKMGVRRKNSHPLMLNMLRELPQSGTFSWRRRRYYLKANYLRQYTQSELADVNRLLDIKTLSSLGYQMVE